MKKLKKIKVKGKKVFSFLWKEVILKYIFCYILCFATLLVTLMLEVEEPWNSWLISFSASMISLPVAFVAYTLYNGMLDRKTRKIVSHKLEEEINNIFVRFIYFSQYFYVEFGNEMWGDEDGINDTLNMKYEKIFEKISDNIFSGMFLFSEFDLYDKYVLDVLNQPIISKYTNEQEVAMLFQFVKGFKELKNSFKIIDKANFIEYGKYGDIEIEESNITRNLEGKRFYDVKVIDESGRRSVIYSAIYSFYEKEKMLCMIKLSGNKSKELSEILYQLYSCIKNWLNYKKKEGLTVSESLAFGGRLYVGADLKINEYMDEGISFSGYF